MRENRFETAPLQFALRGYLLSIIYIKRANKYDKWNKTNTAYCH